MFATFMQIKLKHEYFRQYLIKQDKVDDFKYIDTYRDI